MQIVSHELESDKAKNSEESLFCAIIKDDDYYRKLLFASYQEM